MRCLTRILALTDRLLARIRRRKMLQCFRGYTANELQTLRNFLRRTKRHEPENNLLGLQDEWNEDTGTGTCAEVAPWMEGQGGGEKVRK